MLALYDFSIFVITFNTKFPYYLLESFHNLFILVGKCKIKPLPKLYPFIVFHSIFRPGIWDKNLESNDLKMDYFVRIFVDIWVQDMGGYSRKLK